MRCIGSFSVFLRIKISGSLPSITVHVSDKKLHKVLKASSLFCSVCELLLNILKVSSLNSSLDVYPTTNKREKRLALYESWLIFFFCSLPRVFQYLVEMWLLIMWIPANHRCCVMLLLYFVCKLGVARSYRKLKLFSSTLECFSCGRGGAVHFRCLPSTKRILILQSLATFCTDSVLMLTPHIHKGIVHTVQPLHLYVLNLYIGSVP